MVAVLLLVIDPVGLRRARQAQVKDHLTQVHFSPRAIGQRLRREAPNVVLIVGESAQIVSHRAALYRQGVSV